MVEKTVISGHADKLVDEIQEQLRQIAEELKTQFGDDPHPIVRLFNQDIARYLLEFSNVFEQYRETPPSLEPSTPPPPLAEEEDILVGNLAQELEAIGVSPRTIAVNSQMEEI